MRVNNEELVGKIDALREADRSGDYLLGDKIVEQLLSVLFSPSSDVADHLLSVSLTPPVSPDELKVRGEDYIATVPVVVYEIDGEKMVAIMGYRYPAYIFKNSNVRFYPVCGVVQSSNDGSVP